MANSNLHKAKGRWKKGVYSKIPIQLHLHWNRRNYKRGHFRELRLKKKERIQDQKLKTELSQAS